MKLITFFTESHRKLFDRFCSTLHATNPGIELVSFLTPQRSQSGNYASPGFNQTMLDKLDVILSQWAQLDPNEYFIFADCDIQFFGDVVNDFRKNYDHRADIYFQDDVCRYCAGFMICRPSAKTQSFFEKARRLTPDDPEFDQGAINRLIQTGCEIEVSLLPRDKYFTVASANGCRVWRGENFEVPPAILMHHANWTIGLESKLKIMDFVQQSLAANWAV